MQQGYVVGLLSLLVAGCAAQMVEHDVNASCAKQGKKAFIFDAKQSAIPLLIDSASAMYLCVGPEDVVHLSPAFGADAISASTFKGAGIVSVIPGSVAAKALLKPNDIVVEYGGHTIESAAELRLQVNSTSAGDQAVMSVRRNSDKPIALTAHF
jgi:membrane-associated protease RseP (regulator of RpoE activity)